MCKSFQWMFYLTSFLSLSSRLSEQDSLLYFYYREKKLSRNGSLKVLNHAMSGPDGKDNCNKFVDILGLRTIFPLFMKTPKKNRKRVLTTEEHEGMF